MADSVHNPLEGDRPEMTIKLHENSEDHISIIVVHKDRPEYLNICLQSFLVYQHTVRQVDRWGNTQEIPCVVLLHGNLSFLLVLEIHQIRGHIVQQMQLLSLEY